MRLRTPPRSSPPLSLPDSGGSTPPPAASPRTRDPVKHLPPALPGALRPTTEAAAGRRRWGPVAPTHFPGARSPFRADPQAAAGPGGPPAALPRLGGKPPRGAVPAPGRPASRPPALCKRPPTPRGPSPPPDCPLEKGGGPPGLGLRLRLRVECSKGRVSAPRPLGAPSARPFVPRAALGAARGQRRGPGRRTKKAAGPGRRPLPAPPLASPAGAAAPRTKGPGGGGGCRVSRAGQSARPRLRALEGTRCERRGPGRAVPAHPPVRWP